MNLEIDYPQITQKHRMRCFALCSRSPLRSIADGALDYPQIAQRPALCSRSSLCSIADGAPYLAKQLLV